MSAWNLPKKPIFVDELPRNVPKPSYPRDWKVPHGDYYVFSKKTTRACVIIPVINEGQNIRIQLKRMMHLGLMKQTDVIIVDGGSTDGSVAPQLCKSMGARCLLIKQDEGKLSAQLRMGYAYALISKYQGIITIDGNNKDSVESIPLFVEALEQGFDYAQASRFVRGGRGVNTPLLRLLAIRCVHAPLVSLAAGRRFSDTTQGFRGYSSKYLTHPGVQPFRDVFQSYELLAYLSTRASQLGLLTTEVPTERRYPPDGPMPTKIRSLRGYFGLMKILIFLLAGKYNPTC